MGGASFYPPPPPPPQRMFFEGDTALSYPAVATSDPNPILGALVSRNSLLPKYGTVPIILFRSSIFIVVFDNLKNNCLNFVNYGTVPVPVHNGTEFVSSFYVCVFLIPREECSRCPEGEDQDVAAAHRAAHSQRQDTNQ